MRSVEGPQGQRSLPDERMVQDLNFGFPFEFCPRLGGIAYITRGHFYKADEL